MLKTNKITAPVKFGHGVENRYGDIHYFSKCGQYRIERREYDLLIRSVGYRLFKGEVAVMKHDSDSLAEAKEWACEDVQPGYIDAKYAFQASVLLKQADDGVFRGVTE